MYGIDWYYFPLFGFAIIYPIIAKLVFGKSISLPEMGINIIIVVIAIVAVLQIGRSATMADYEVWNGQVTGLEREQIPCEHPYDCFCTTDSDGYTSCLTCYEHDHDYAYMVRTTIGDFRIANLASDPQGLRAPPRWLAIEEGDPVSKLNRYTNYIHGIGPSYFGEDELVEQFSDMLPEYPDDVRDYYHINRVLDVGVNVPELEAWNDGLADILRHLGPQRQANVVLVFANTSDPDYLYALEQHWLGGKKNDVVVVVGTPSFPSISWAGVFALNENESFEPRLARAIETLGVVDRTALLATIDAEVMDSYERMPMANFEELKKQVKPPLGAIILAALLCIFGSIGLSFFFHRNEVA